jgi:hypothetical protein
MSLEEDLRRAVRPVDPGPEFTARVLAAVEADSHGGQSSAVADRAPALAYRRQWARRSWMWPALAASLVGAVAGARYFEVKRETERGLEARTQLMQALRVTSQKLAVAREVMDEKR